MDVKAALRLTLNYGEGGGSVGVCVVCVFGVESGRVWVEGERQLEKDKYIRKTKVRSGTFIANGRHVTIRLLHE